MAPESADASAAADDLAADESTVTVASDASVASASASVSTFPSASAPFPFFFFFFLGLSAFSRLRSSFCRRLKSRMTWSSSSLSSFGGAPLGPILRARGTAAEMGTGADAYPLAEVTVQHHVDAPVSSNVW